jgi:dTDP-4-dehydrorhamnose reductase
MTRILITGAEGGLGRAWVQRLKSPGLTLAPALAGPIEVIACSRAGLDVASQDAAAGISEIRPDVVLNCAGKTDLESCESSAWEAFRVNRDGADHIAKACAKLDAVPVYFSTDHVFDGGKLQPYREEDPPNPLNVYGETKLAGELRTASATRRHLIVRSGWIYGQPGRHFLRPLFGSVPFEVSDAQIGQATWIEDFLDAAIFLLRTGRAGRWHVASPGAVTQAGAVRRARAWLGAGPPSQVRRRTGGPPLPGSSVLDIRKLSQAGHAMRPWEEGLDAYIKKRAT